MDTTLCYNQFAMKSQMHKNYFDTDGKGMILSKINLKIQS